MLRCLSKAQEEPAVETAAELRDEQATGTIPGSAVAGCIAFDLLQTLVGHEHDEISVIHQGECFKNP